MRIRSGLFVLGFVSLATAGVLVACGSSSSSGDDSSTNGNDAASDVNNGDTSTTTVTANASDLTVYVLQNAVVAGSATPTSATFAWTVTTVPTGSAITTASLAGATTATPSFTPDVNGDYALTLVASAGAVTATKTATVHAIPGKGFVVHEYDGGGGTLANEILLMNSDGTGRVPIVCPVKSPLFGLILDSNGGLDWLEGDAGQPAAVAFPYADVDDAGNVLDSFLAAGTSDSRCGGATTVAKLDLQNVDAGGNVPRYTRLSSTGQRIAYLREVGTGLFAATIGFDGSDLRVFGSAYLASDGGPGQSGNSTIVPPVWVDSTQIAWVEIAADNSSWSIKIARDEPSATISTFMTCKSASTGASADIFQFELLANGTAIVAAQPSTFDAGNFVQLLVLSPDPTTHVCNFVRAFSTGSGVAKDFSVSPDQTKVAYLGSASGNSGTFSLYVAAISGTSPPAIVPGAPVQGITGTGPRWASNGNTIIWGQGPIVDGGGATVYSVPAAGGTAKAIAASTDPNESYLSVGNSNCNVAFENSSPVAAFAMLGIFVGLIVRRRRNKK